MHETLDPIHDEIIEYDRVSSAAQDELSQHIASGFYTKGLDQSKITRLSDHGVSAMKYSWKQRPALRKAITMFEDGLANTLVVYARDRICRDPYEWIEILDKLRKLHIKIIFTRTGEPPVQDNIMFEALLGYSAYVEGVKIGERIRDVQRLRPAHLFGYTRSKGDGGFHYALRADLAPGIQSLFEAVLEARDFFELEDALRHRMRTLKLTIPRVIKLLNTPLYAAIREDNGEATRVDYVEPLVTVQLFFDVREKLLELMAPINEGVRQASAIPITPRCEECGAPMKYRDILPEPEWYCRLGHRKLSAYVTEVADLVRDRLVYAVEHLDAQKLARELRKAIQKHKKLLETHRTSCERKLDELAAAMFSQASRASVRNPSLRYEEAEKELSRTVQLLKQLGNHEHDANQFLRIHDEYIKHRLLLPGNYEVLVDNLIKDVFVGRGYVRLEFFDYEYISWGDQNG